MGRLSLIKPLILVCLRHSLTIATLLLILSDHTLQVSQHISLIKTIGIGRQTTCTIVALFSSPSLSTTLYIVFCKMIISRILTLVEYLHVVDQLQDLWLTGGCKVIIHFQPGNAHRFQVIEVRPWFQKDQHKTCMAFFRVCMITSRY